MMKRLALVLALVLLPGAAMAQQHQHQQAKPEAGKAEHMNFARELIAAKADLKLSAEQITKLEAFSAKMDEMHKKMAAMHKDSAQAHAGHGEMKQGNMAEMEGKMHADLLAIFTEDQLVKVRPMMKAHMEKCEQMMSGQKKAEHKH
ncbi:MAG TPA: hypothetical protein VFO52_09340 [Longimicrobiales bacterium]|nr:hypothetical protein [Longimicrobiales bacterium]